MNDQKITQLQCEAQLMMVLCREHRDINDELQRANELLEERLKLLERCVKKQQELEDSLS